ncbi:MAG TPA: chromosome segregation protein SMC, partial [Firmicutes bacterium]|nr:chromosome segregation protein SMC [Bacillota bacterium]
MRLKRLEIQGFKSFARPVSLDFGQGITAIVGPNGSGKSNISDALRWVMGEQSAKSLRGYKMEDVIFAGSDGKRPLGMAEVQVTLDNSDGFFPLDYAELTVTRRVYRSGDSEFLINKQSCRLRDIHDLFTDTGLGREGYAVIGQGQIDAVLSVRPEDRRVLLEETAGIVKYRQRKEQALRKLEDTSIDLLRVTDILHELESQLGPLEEQAKQARLYLDLAERLQGAELDLYHLTWHGLDQKWVERQERLVSLQASYDGAAEELHSLEEQKLRLDREEQHLEEEIEGHRQDLMDLTEGYNQGVHTIQLYQERLQNHNTRSEQLTGLIRAQEDELERLQSEGSGLKKQFTELLEQIRVQEETIAQAELGVEDLQQRHKKGQMESQGLKDDFFDFMRELTERRNFQRGFGERQSNLESQIAANQDELQRFTESMAVAGKQVRELDEKRLQLADALEALAVREQQTQSELEGAKRNLAQHQSHVRGMQEKLAQVTSRLKTLQEFEEGYAGYAFGVKRIMQHGEMSKLVFGTVADVITVPSGLETAFEVALGAGLQNLITPGEAEAKTLIAWLQKVQGGRVTILPLDTIKGSEFSPDRKNLLNQAGVLGTALDLLTISKQYLPALASLLGRVVITEDLDTALRLKRDLGQFSRIVTRDGSVVFPSGAMTGGSLNNRTSGLL